ncbi:MAG: hypothetical protein ACETWQ_12965 [Phycisphaerae bacterium]
MQGKPLEVNVTLSRQIPLTQIIQRKPVELQIELRVLNEPKTLALSSVRILSAIRIELPAIKLTRIDHRVVFVGKAQWADLTTGLVTVLVKLDISTHRIVAPGTVLILEPCGDVVKVDGTPVTIYSGQHTVDIILTGRVDCANSSVRWPLQLRPPLSSFGIRYIEPSPVTVSFTAPRPAQAILSNNAARGRDKPYTAFPRLLDKPLRHLSSDIYY